METKRKFAKLGQDLTDEMNVWFSDVPNVIQDFDHKKFAFFGLYGDLWRGWYEGSVIQITPDIEPDDNSVQYIIEQVKDSIELTDGDFEVVIMEEHFRSGGLKNILFKFYYSNGNK